MVHGRLTCRGREATQTLVDGDVIKQERCTVAGCAQDSVRKNEIWRDGFVGSTLVADLDGKLLVAWYDRNTVPLMKIAPIKEMRGATPIVLFDPYTQGGLIEDKAADAPSRIFVGNRFALMVVAPPQGVFVMRILPDGSFSFVKPAGDR